MKFKLVLFLVVVLFSCEKETTYCWECSTQEYKAFVRYGMPQQDTILCDKSETFIYNYEQLGTHSDNKGNGIDVICHKVIKN